jgi:WD40 repeat protein
MKKKSCCRFIYLLVAVFWTGSAFVFAQKPILTLQLGHNQRVSRLAQSPDGKFLASASLDNTAKIWDVTSGRLLTTLSGHQNFVKAVNFSPDGKLVATASYDKTIRTWNPENGMMLKSFAGHSKGVEAVCFSPNGKVIASGGLDKTILLWDTESGQQLSSISTETEIMSLVFSLNGKILFASTSTGAVQLWNVANGKLISTFSRQQGLVYDLKLSKDGKKLASCAEDKTLVIYDATSGKALQTLRFRGSLGEEVDDIVSASFSTDGQFVAGVTSSKRLVYWETSTGKQVKAVNLPVISTVVEFAANGTSIFYAQGGGAMMADSQTSAVSRVFDGLSSAVTSVAVSPDNHYFAFSNFGSQIGLADAATGKFLRTFAGHADVVEAVAFSADNKILASGSRDKNIILFDAANGQVLQTIKGHSDAVTSLAFRADGKYVVSGSYDKTVRMWETSSGQVARWFDGHTDKVMSVAISPKDGNILASGSFDKTAKLWDVQANKMLFSLDGHAGEVWAVVFSPDGSKVVSGSSDKTVKIWDVATGTLLKTLEGHNDYVKALTFSPDGKYLASGSWDNTVIVWEMATGNLIYTFKGHQNYVRTLAFLQNNLLLSGSSDAQIKLWDLTKGREILNFVGFRNGKDYVVTSPEGYFEGTGEAVKTGLHYVQGTEIILLEGLYEKFYMPNLWSSTLSGNLKIKPEININNTIKLPPSVRVAISPNVTKGTVSYSEGICTVNSQSIELVVEATDLGGGIDELRLYHNGKLIDNTQRAFKPLANKGESKSKTFTVTLVNGVNEFVASAFNTQRTEASSDKLSITFNGVQSNINLYILSIGINQYKNNVMNLNYAKADAQAFMDALSKGSKGIFNQIKTFTLADQNFTRENTIKTFDDIASQVTAQDVFVFYYAGHGVMVENKGQNEFYIVPHDVTQLYGAEDALAAKGISTADLLDMTRKVKAQKQLLVLDACQSGGAVQAFSSRGAAEQKAIIQLARSAGVTLLAASGSEQFATEVRELGHGIFTYALVEGISGDADGGSKDGKVTVNELKSFIEDRVPTLSEKYKGQAQYPTGFSKGQDFPIVVPVK